MARGDGVVEADRSAGSRPDIDGLTPYAAAELAASPDASLDDLVALGGSDRPQVVSAVAENPKTPPEAFDRMAETAAGARLAATHPSTPAATLERLVRRHRAGPVTALVASNPSLPVELVPRLAKSKSWHVRAHLASNPATPGPTVAKLAEDRVWAVRHHAARSPNLPAERAAALADDVAAVRLQLAANPAVGQTIAERLTRDDDPWVGGLARSHPSLDADALCASAEGLDQPAWVLRRIADHPACPEDLADQLAAWVVLGGGDGDPDFDPIRCTGNPGRDDEYPVLAFARLAREAAASELPFHPLYLTRTHQLKPESPAHQALAAEDPEPDVRATLLLRWPLLPLSLVRGIMRSDPSPAVVSAAQRQIDQRQAKTEKMSVPGVLVTVAVIAFVLAVIGGVVDDDRDVTSLTGTSFGLPSLPTVSFPAFQVESETITTPGGAALIVSRWANGLESILLTVATADDPIEIIEVSGDDGGGLVIGDGVLPTVVDADSVEGIRLFGRPPQELTVVLREGGTERRIIIAVPTSEFTELLDELRFPTTTSPPPPPVITVPTTAPAGNTVPTTRS